MIRAVYNHILVTMYRNKLFMSTGTISEPSKRSLHGDWYKESMPYIIQFVCAFDVSLHLLHLVWLCVIFWWMKNKIMGNILVVVSIDWLTSTLHTKSSGVTASDLLPSNLFALKIAFLSQSVQYIQSSNNVTLNGCFSFSGEYKMTLKIKNDYVKYSYDKSYSILNYLM